MKTYKARGVVLHTLKYGENSMVLFMLTDTHGRQSYMVQGVRSRKGRGNRAALYQPMFVLDLVGLESSRMQMHRIKEARSAFPMTSVPFDVRKSTISLFMAEVLYRLVKEVEPQSPLLGFVCDAVAALDAIGDGVANFHLWFLVHLSAYLGFYPGNEYEQGSVFDIQEGLFTLLPPGHGFIINPDNSRILGQLMESDVARLGEIQLGRAQRSDFLSSMLTYFGYHLDAIHNVRSIQILHDVF